MTGIESAVGEFMLNCEAEGLKDTTVTWYRSLLGRFASAHPLKPVGEFTTHDLRLYLASLRRSYSQDSVSDHNRALHRFWKWAALEYAVPNPMRTIKYLQPPPAKIPKAVPLEKIIAMFRAAEAGKSAARDKAILAFALDTGCRAGGIVSLPASGINLQKRRALVVEKGSKTRSVLFTRVTAALLLLWAEEREPYDTFFYSLATGEPLKPNSLYLLFRRLARRAGLRDKIGPHGFRHTFSINYILNGGDILTLTRILGHESADTTARHYAIFSDLQVGEAHEKYSPINQVFKQEE